MKKLLLIAMLGAYAPLAAAEEPAAKPGAGDYRFQLERTANGVIRLDKQTGAMALCQENNGELICRMGADERAAYEEDLSRVEKRVEALEKIVRAGKPVEKSAIPSEDELNRAFSFMENVMRRFMGLVQDLNKEEQPDKSLPQKT